MLFLALSFTYLWHRAPIEPRVANRFCGRRKQTSPVTDLSAQWPCPPSLQRAGAMEPLPAPPFMGGSMQVDDPDFTPLLSLLPTPPDVDALLLLASVAPPPPGQWLHALVECGTCSTLFRIRRTHERLSCALTCV